MISGELCLSVCSADMICVAVPDVRVCGVWVGCVCVDSVCVLTVCVLTVCVLTVCVLTVCVCVWGGEGPCVWGE